MTSMISEVYSAFRKAGVPEEEAKQAAEAFIRALKLELCNSKEASIPYALMKKPKEPDAKNSENEINRIVIKANWNLDKALLGVCAAIKYPLTILSYSVTAPIAATIASRYCSTG